MQRRQFIRQSVIISTGSSMLSLKSTEQERINLSPPPDIHPRAITMWDFSWIERRWPGAGYEDWDRALDELAERGYNAVRIDAFPHFLGADATREYTLRPVWSVQQWGSPGIIKVRLLPALPEFISKCQERDIKVGLSSWFRDDVEQMRLQINSPAKMADLWIKTLDHLKAAGLLNSILYVDLCNEWPGDLWSPFFTNDPPNKTWGYWHTPASMQFMRTSLELVRQAYPQVPLCYSFTGGEPALYAQRDLSFFDLLEHHIWMAQLRGGEFDKAVGYAYDRFNEDSYNRLATNHVEVYQSRKRYWQQILLEEIDLVARSARAAKLPLITTECWGLVDFKDWPSLDWGIIKELGELAVQKAVDSGQWLALASSNFAGPQFAGMWRDKSYHQRLTRLIRTSAIHPDLNHTKLAGRL